MGRTAGGQLQQQQPGQTNSRNHARSVNPFPLLVYAVAADVLVMCPLMAFAQFLATILIDGAALDLLKLL